MHNFRDLDCWKFARHLVKEVYTITANFPPQERYGLTNQIRRCAVSIPSNIAEGCGRGTDPQTIHFLNVAQGSCCELETQLMLSSDLNFLNKNQTETLINQLQRIQKMLRGFKNKLENDGRN